MEVLPSFTNSWAAGAASPSLIRKPAPRSSALADALTGRSRRSGSGPSTPFEWSLTSGVRGFAIADISVGTGAVSWMLDVPNTLHLPEGCSACFLARTPGAMTEDERKLLAGHVRRVMHASGDDPEAEVAPCEAAEWRTAEGCVGLAVARAGTDLIDADEGLALPVGCAAAFLVRGPLTAAQREALSGRLDAALSVGA